MAERVLVLTMPRLLWVGGLVFAGTSLLLALAVWHAAPLFAMVFGLIVAAFPLFARLDAVKLDGPLLSVRRAVRWVGPVDLDHLVAFSHRPLGYRSPPVWLLVQRVAGPRFGKPARVNFGPEIQSQLADDGDLRVLVVAAGGQLSELPGLAEHLATHVLASDALVEPRARAELDRLRRR